MKYNYVNGLCYFLALKIKKNIFSDLLNVGERYQDLWEVKNWLLIRYPLKMNNFLINYSMKIDIIFLLYWLW